MPQPGELVYFFAHGYEAFAGAHAFYFFTGNGRGEEERAVLEPVTAFPQPLLCRVQSAQFRLPSALTFFLEKTYGEELVKARAGEALEALPYSFDSSAGTPWLPQELVLEPVAHPGEDEENGLERRWAPP